MFHITTLSQITWDELEREAGNQLFYISKIMAKLK